MYKLCQRTAYVHSWKFAADYIEERRKTPSHTTLYENFEALAKKWMDY